MKKEISFLGHSKPLLTAMVQAKTPEEACCIITDSMYDGAEAIPTRSANSIFLWDLKQVLLFAMSWATCISRKSTASPMMRKQ